MKNQLFGKATALVMGSLLFFSSQALAIPSNNNQELSSADTSRESEFIVAQATDRLSPQEQIALSQSIAQAASSLSNALALAQSAAIPNTATRSIYSASAILGHSLTLSRSATVTRRLAIAIANSLSEVTNLINRSLDLIPDTPGGKSVVDSLGEALQNVQKSANASRGILCPEQSGANASRGGTRLERAGANASRGIRRPEKKLR